MRHGHSSDVTEFALCGHLVLGMQPTLQSCPSPQWDSWRKHNFHPQVVIGWRLGLGLRRRRVPTSPFSSRTPSGADPCRALCCLRLRELIRGSVLHIVLTLVCPWNKVSWCRIFHLQCGVGAQTFFGLGTILDDFLLRDAQPAFGEEQTLSSMEISSPETFRHRTSPTSQGTEFQVQTQSPGIPRDPWGTPLASPWLWARSSEWV